MGHANRKKITIVKKIEKRKPILNLPEAMGATRAVKVTPAHTSSTVKTSHRKNWAAMCGCASSNNPCAVKSNVRKATNTLLLYDNTN